MPACVLAVAIPSRAADPLFPTPLHLVRQIDDPLTGHAVTLDEYCAGDRIVTVNGPKTTIVDYGRQQITEIDHRAGTYSITAFEDVARARSARTVIAARDWKVTPLGLRGSSAGRSLDTFEIVSERPGVSETIQFGLDHQVNLSRAAAEVLIGAAYPNVRKPQHDALLKNAVQRRIAATSAATGDQYALIAEQTITYRERDLTVVVKNSVVSSDSASVPPDALLIDPAATRVESRLTRFDKELHDIEQLPSSTKKP